MSSKKEKLLPEVAKAINYRLDRYELYARHAKERVKKLLGTEHNDWAEKMTAYWTNVLSAINWMRVQPNEISKDTNDEYRAIGGAI